MMLSQPPKTKIEAKKKEEFDISTDFTEAELDRMLNVHTIEQEINKMRAKGVCPSQRKGISASSEITADVVDAVRWQEQKETDLNLLKTTDTNKEKPWIQEIIEDFIAAGLSPSNTKDEAKVLLETLQTGLKSVAEGGYGPEARNYITTLIKELELLLEKL